MRIITIERGRDGLGVVTKDEHTDTDVTRAGLLDRYGLTGAVSGRPKRSSMLIDCADINDITMEAISGSEYPVTKRMASGAVLATSRRIAPGWWGEPVVLIDNMQRAYPSTLLRLHGIIMRGGHANQRNGNQRFILAFRDDGASRMKEAIRRAGVATGDEPDLSDVDWTVTTTLVDAFIDDAGKDDTGRWFKDRIRDILKPLQPLHGIRIVDVRDGMVLGDRVEGYESVQEYIDFITRRTGESPSRLDAGILYPDDIVGLPVIVDGQKRAAIPFAIRRNDIIIENIGNAAPSTLSALTSLLTGSPDAMDAVAETRGHTFHLINATRWNQESRKATDEALDGIIAKLRQDGAAPLEQ